MFRKLLEVNLQMAFDQCHALNHPLRLSMVRLLEQHEELTVTQVYFKLRVSQSVASQHLTILRKCDLICHRREGKQVFYQLNKPKMQVLLQAIVSMTSPDTTDPLPAWR